MTTSQSWSGIYKDHPVRPVPQDPLARLTKIRADYWAAEDKRRPRIGLACLWDCPPQRTWSYTPWNLRAALNGIADTADIGVATSRLSRVLLKTSHVRYKNGKLISSWRYSRLTDLHDAHILHRELRRNSADRRYDAILTMQALVAAIGLPAPTFVYTDITNDAWISATQSLDVCAALRLVKASTLQRYRERELALYQQATGVITMSGWLARSLVEQTGLPPAKVHVVHPAMSSGWSPSDGTPGFASGNAATKPATVPIPERTAPRRKLLFVGRQPFDFYRKGGDLIVAALKILRREHDSRITLTVVGPDQWPMPGDPPEGVRLMGTLPPDRVAALYDTHDLFVMPSRMEPFGIVFTEALARGLPCVARDAYAMPEIITPGLSGALVTSDDDHELAATIATVLADDALYEACRKRAPEMAAYFSWERVAWEITRVITQGAAADS